MRYELQNRGVGLEISKGSVVLALMEVVMGVDGLERAAKGLIEGWRFCGGWGMTVLSLSCVVVTLGEGWLICWLVTRLSNSERISCKLFC